MNKKTIKIVIAAVVLVTLALMLVVLPEKFFGHTHRPECECSICSTMNKNLQPILEKTKEYVEREIDKKEIKDIAVYFRDLKSGSWFAINKDEKFNLASLIKVPLMMECLESVESQPGMLQKRLLFTGEKDWTSQQNIKPKKFLEPGRMYSLDEIMFRMIAYSDNNAMSMLLNEFPGEGLDRFFSDHNIEYEKSPEGYLMSLGTYTTFFDTLYNQSLLNSTMSKKALAYLDSEDFPQGMHAAVPVNVKIEGKFGEKILLDEHDNGKNAQLHEVGIVQAGDHPFILGIMTSGKDLIGLEKVIKEITHNVYEENEQMTRYNSNNMDCMTRCHVNNSGA